MMTSERDEMQEPDGGGYLEAFPLVRVHQHPDRPLTPARRPRRHRH
jgi:hypothetical protein